MYSITQSIRIIAAEINIISPADPRVTDDSSPVNSARTANRLLTAAASTGIPKYQLIYFFADAHSVSYTAPSLMSVLYLRFVFCSFIRNWTPITVFATIRKMIAR